MTPGSAASAPCKRLAVWYGKGGVGKSTTTMMLSLMAARRGKRVLTVDLDPECGCSRDFLGPALRDVPHNLKSYLESPVPGPPQPIASGIDNLDILPSSPDEQRFFRHFPEHSDKLRDGLSFLDGYDWMFMDVPNQFDNIAELGLIAADYVIFPVELTADCAERIDTALRIINEAKAVNPTLTLLGALPLASSPQSQQSLKLTAKERLVYHEYGDRLAEVGVTPLKTIMYRSATTVEEARSNADDKLMHWTAQRRFTALFAEIVSRIKTARRINSPKSHDVPRRNSQPARTTI